MKPSKDRGGFSTILVVAVAAIVVIGGLLAVAFFAYGGAEKDTVDPPGDEDDPIIGYIDITADVVMDNSEAVSGVDVYVDDVDADFQSQNPDSLTFSEWLEQMDLIPQERNYEIKFTVDSPQNENYHFTSTVDKRMEAGSLEKNTYEVDPDRTFTVRYGGSYNIVVQVFHEGSAIDTMSTTVEVDA